MSTSSRVLTQRDRVAIHEVVRGIMFKAHPPDQPYQGECDSCAELDMALGAWSYNHREEENKE